MILLLVLIIVGIISLLLFWDFKGPDKIFLKESSAFGLPCFKANDLLVQEFDEENNLWASRGMIIYKLNRGDNHFRKIGRVPTGWNIYWLRNFGIIRKITARPECIEYTVAKNGDISAFSAGKVWLQKNGHKKFVETHSLKHYGMGNQGIRNVGISKAPDNNIYLGEYFANPKREEVNIFGSEDNGQNWSCKYTFAPGEIRHIHGIQYDAYEDNIWFMAGDLDKESKICYTNDRFESIHNLGEGNQIYRVCQVVFTKTHIYWGTDTSDHKTAGIYQYERNKKILKKIGDLPGAVFFATILKNGLIVLTTNRENNLLEKDDYTRFYLIGENGTKIKELLGGTRKSKKPGIRHKYAQLRLQRYQGADALAVSVLNQKEFSDSELLIFSENSLMKAFQDQHN